MDIPERGFKNGICRTGFIERGFKKKRQNNESKRIY